ncbi:helix-turn-helix domain-containing protein [Amycolatopsis sp. NPDC047767]|uniref:TetR/AcrR family transcriptional regulator n=1 Tax=Amycolatopsis sp. NPDC047767 TaxID=3156765 RepID=UPI003454E474
MAQETAGPRSRILAVATELFYRHGINTTGIAEVADRAGVSKRTLYQLFPGKDLLVAAYLDGIAATTERDTGDGNNEYKLFDLALSPRERLLGLFDRPAPVARYRGCPFHDAAVELAGLDHPGLPLVIEHKHGILRRLIDTARQAGATDPDLLGRQVAVLFEGAMALSTSLNSTEAFDFARTAAVVLLDAALPA